MRRRIEVALAGGQLVGSDGSATTWRVCHSRPGDIEETELEHTGRLIRSSRQSERC